MKLVIFNGSPRGVKSNSEIIINSFKNGFEKRYPDSVRIHHLVDTDYHDKFLKDLQNFDKFMIVFPLYTDAMPGIVKLFLEKLMLNPPVGEMQLSFLIHSGFPEGIHASAIVPYLEKFTHRLGCRYMGTIIKPGTEGLNTLSKKNRRLSATNNQMYQLGKYYAYHHTHDKSSMEKMKQPYILPPFVRFIVRIMSKTGIINIYWKRMQTKNKAYKDRFAKPYAN